MARLSDGEREIQNEANRDAMESERPGVGMVYCPECGGYGGEPGSNFGDYGWHPCYFCGSMGVITQERLDAYDRAQAEMPEPRHEYREGDDLGWEGDGNVYDDPQVYGYGEYEGPIDPAPLDPDELPF
jgi:hypothetical protein